MAGSLKHAFTSPVADENVAGEVGPDEWNAAHVQDAAGLVGKTTAGASEVLSAAEAKAFLAIVGADVTGGDLTKVDDTNVTLTLGGTPAGALLKATSITVGWSGQLAPERGGTGISALGSGVATALGVNVGSAGAFVTFNGALGTPGSGTLTNCTGLPVSSGVAGLGTGVATALAVNIGSAGAPVLFDGAGGTPSALTLTNATGLPLTTGVTGVLPVANGGVDPNAWTAFTPTVTANSGTITTLGAVSGRYKLSGKTVFWQLSIAITTNGSGGGFIRAAGLPFTTAAFRFIGVGQELNVTGDQLIGHLPTSSSECLITFYDGSYPGGDGRLLVLNGIAEIA